MPGIKWRNVTIILCHGIRKYISWPRKLLTIGHRGCSPTCLIYLPVYHLWLKVLWLLCRINITLCRILWLSFIFISWKHSELFVCWHGWIKSKFKTYPSRCLLHEWTLHESPAQGQKTTLVFPFLKMGIVHFCSLYLLLRPSPQIESSSWI